MVAFVTLTEEEADLILHGVLPDPTFRPRNDMFGDYEEEDDDDDADEEGHDDATEGKTQELPTPPLTRFVAAAHWRASTIDVALLLRRIIGRTEAVDQKSLELVALARAEAPHRYRTGRTGVRVLNITEIHTLSPTLLLSDLIGPLSRQLRSTAISVVNSRIRPLPPTTGAALAKQLRAHIVDYDTIVARLTTFRRRLRTAGPERESWLEARDASITALRLFDSEWRKQRPIANARTIPSDLDAIISSATENDYITDDVDVFPEWTRHRSRGGWVQFESHGRRLFVKNVNVSPTETTTGADLIYWRTKPDAFVVVQYKKLEWIGTDFAYRVEDRLPSQIRRMIECTRPVNADPAVTVDAYRLARTSAFVKFVAPLTRHAEDELVPGQYLPAELVGLLLQHPEAGPRGGKIIRVPQGRGLNSEMFVRLIRDGWLGTDREVSDALHELLPGLRAAASAHLTIAYDTLAG